MRPAGRWSRGNILHLLYLIGVWFKGIDGILEMAGGNIEWQKEARRGKAPAGIATSVLFGAAFDELLEIGDGGFYEGLGAGHFDEDVAVV